MINRQKIAKAFRRNPRLARTLVQVYRLTQPHYTAGVTGVLFNNQQQLFLVEHVFHVGEAWGLPGGWIGRAEPPENAIRREFQEETGLLVEVVRPLLVTQGTFWNHLDMAFLLKTDDPSVPIILSMELLEYGWFNLDALPPLRKFHRDALNAALQGFSR